MDKKQLSKNLNILREFTLQNVKSNYRNSVFGMLWSLLNPLLNMLVMYLIFSQFFGRNDPLYPVYLLSGNIIYSAFKASTEVAMQSIVRGRGLIQRVKVNKYLFPLSSICSSFINSSFSICALFIIMLFMQLIGGHALFGYQILFIILMIPAFFLFCFGSGLILCSLFVFFRDIRYLYSIFLTLLMYLTPIFYKIESFATDSIAYNIVRLNPLYYFLKYFRSSVYMIHSAGGAYPPSFRLLTLLYVIAIVFITLGILIFRKLKKKFVMYI